MHALAGFGLRHLGGAVLSAALVFGLGYFWSSPPARSLELPALPLQPISAPTDAVVDASTVQRIANAQPAILDAGALDVAVADAAMVASIDAATPVVAAKDEPRFVDIVLSEAVAKVEGNQEGKWFGMEAREVVGLGGDVRCGKASKAVFELGEKSRLTLLASSRLLRSDVVENANDLTLGFGKVQIECTQPEDAIRILQYKGKAFVQGCSNGYEVFARRKSFGVLARNAAATLNLGSKAIEVAAGQAAWVNASGKLEGPVAFDAEPRLKLSKFSRSVSSSSVVIKGTTHPLAEVWVNDVKAKVNAKGAFTAKIALDVGSNTIEVRARHITGAEIKLDEGEIKRSAKKAQRAPTVRWGAGN